MQFDIHHYLETHQKGLIQYLGIEITTVSPGYCKGRIEVKDMHNNPMGGVHGGCLFTLADTIGGIAAISHGYQVVTINSQIHYVNPAIHTKYILAEANEIKYGRQISVYEVHITNDDGLLVATATLSFYKMNKLTNEDEN